MEVAFTRVEEYALDVNDDDGFDDEATTKVLIVEGVPVVVVNISIFTVVKKRNRSWRDDDFGFLFAENDEFKNNNNNNNNDRFKSVKEPQIVLFLPLLQFCADDDEDRQKTFSSCGCLCDDI